MKYLSYLLLFLLFTGCAIDLSKDESSKTSDSCVTTTYGTAGSCATFDGNSMVGSWYIYDGNLTVVINSEDNSTSYRFTEDSLIADMDLEEDGTCWYRDIENHLENFNQNYNWAKNSDYFTLVNDYGTEKSYLFFMDYQNTGLIFFRDNNTSQYIFKKYQ